MTDLPTGEDNVPGRLGATARLDGDDLVIDLEPHDALLRHGVVRASVHAYLVDCVAGIPLQRTDAWTLTTDLSVRTVARPAPRSISARAEVLRSGARTATSRVSLVDEDGVAIGEGLTGFSRVEHRPGDPPLVMVPPAQIVDLFGSLPRLDTDLRDAADIDVLDAAAGVIEVPLTGKLRNSAGTLQGAMTALVAEVAAEECLSAAAGRPVVVTDLDIRYLTRTGDGPIRTRTTRLGDGAAASVAVELVDASTDALVAIVQARGTAG